MGFCSGRASHLTLPGRGWKGWGRKSGCCSVLLCLGLCDVSFMTVFKRRSSGRSRRVCGLQSGACSIRTGRRQGKLPVAPIPPLTDSATGPSLGTTAVSVSHGFPQEEQEPADAEPRVCDPEPRRHGVVFGHDYPARPDV